MDPLVLIGAALGVVWCAVVFLRGGLLAGCATVLLTGSCFGPYFFSLPTPPIPLTADRLLLLLVLAQYGVWRCFGWANRKPLDVTDLAVISFLGVLTVSTFTHDWHVEKNMPLSRLLFFYFMPFSLYWVARQITQTPRGAYALFAGLGVFSLYLAITAIAETRDVTALVFPSYISSPEHGEFLGRGRGPFLNPAACGMFQAIGLCAAWLWWPRLGRFARAGLLGYTLLMLFGIYSTYTRSAWMGGALGLMITLGVQLPRGWRMPLVASALIAGTLVVATQWENLLAFKRDKALSSEDTKESAMLRSLLAGVAWNMFLDHPVDGCGFGQYMQQNVNYINDRATELPLAKSRPYVQHNVWLGLLTETGLLGVVSFSVVAWLWVRHAWRGWRAETSPPWARRQALLFVAASGAYLPNAMFQDMAIVPMVNMMMFFLAGLSEGLRHQLATVEEQPPVPARPTVVAPLPRWPSPRSAVEAPKVLPEVSP